MMGMGSTDGEGVVSIFGNVVENTMINNWYKVFIGLLLGLFLCGFFFGRRFLSSYQAELIAVKYIDGRYGKSFYCVEVLGKKRDGVIKVFAKIHIGGLASGYYHDCGEIGSANDWIMARQNYGTVRLEGENLLIGDSFAIAKKQYENHR